MGAQSAEQAAAHHQAANEMLDVLSFAPRAQHAPVLRGWAGIMRGVLDRERAAVDRHPGELLISWRGEGTHADNRSCIDGKSKRKSRYNKKNISCSSGSRITTVPDRRAPFPHKPCFLGVR
jgi:hypothetical protein